MLELIGELADGGCLAYTVDPNDHDDVRMRLGRECEALPIGRAILCKECRHFVTQDAFELARADIFVPSHTLFDTLDDLERRVHAHITRHEYILQVVKDCIVDLALASYGTSQLVYHRGLALL